MKACCCLDVFRYLSRVWTLIPPTFVSFYKFSHDLFCLNVFSIPPAFCYPGVMLMFVLIQENKSKGLFMDLQCLNPDVLICAPLQNNSFNSHGPSVVEKLTIVIDMPHHHGMGDVDSFKGEDHVSEDMDPINICCRVVFSKTNVCKVGLSGNVSQSEQRPEVMSRIPISRFPPGVY